LLLRATNLPQTQLRDNASSHREAAMIQKRYHIRAGAKTTAGGTK
jgi:hypothetical protein